MGFLRDVLGLPVPRILAYSSSSDGPVGAIISLWNEFAVKVLRRDGSLTTQEVKHIMVQLAEIEQKILSF